MARNAAARVRGEKRVAGTRRKDGDPPLFQMTDRATPDVILTDLVDLQRRHDAGMGADALESILESQRIDDRCQHPHVVAGDPIHSGPGKARAAENIAAANHDAQLHAESHDFFHLGGNAGQHMRDRCRSRHRP